MPDPKKTYSEAISQLKANPLFTEADSTKKDAILDSFFETYGRPYLKSQGIAGSDKVNSYKKQFVSSMMSPSPQDGSKKKRPVRLKNQKKNPTNFWAQVRRILKKPVK